MARLRVVAGAALGGALFAAGGFGVAWLVAMVIFPSQGLDALAMIGLVTIGAALFGVIAGGAVGARVR